MLVDPLDVVGISDGLLRLLDDPALADSLRRAGPERAAQFTWERSLHSLVAYWRKALA